MRAAIELELFTAIAEGQVRVPDLAAHCAASERGIRILCDYLTIQGFLTKEGDRYGLAPDAAFFLDRRSPAYMGGIVEFLLSPTLLESYTDLTTTVRQGTTTLPGEGTVAPDHPVWQRFARAMAPMMAAPAEEIVRLVPFPPLGPVAGRRGGGGPVRSAGRLPSLSGRPLRLLDIAAGHGLFGIAFARAHPALEVTALDWPAVLEVARENAKAAGVSERHRLLPGDAFAVEFGSGYDLVLLTNFLHHFDIPTCERLLKKVHAALGEGGRAVTLEFVPNEDRISPPHAAAFSLVMLAGTGGGDAYTFSQLDAMFRNAGFSKSTLHDLTTSPGRLVVSER
jgi:ubiquinone/menaquinone biosynthesis C-methylase UbiE